MIDKKKQGRRNRLNGAIFERRVRADLISKCFFVDRWTNNVQDGKCLSAKTNRFGSRTTGFPDFLAYRLRPGDIYEINFIECKMNGSLSKIEKEKAQLYLKRNYCHHFYIAYKTKEKNRVRVNYKEVKIDGY